MNKKDFAKQLRINFPKITDKELELFEIYKSFLQKENKKYNLTRLDSEEVIYQKYFYNSVIPFINIDLVNKKILDIGSGSGIPGIALKIIEPTISLTIIESNSKKMNFMQSLVKLMGFQDVEFILNRAEECAHKYKENFDIVTSRAVSMLNVLLEISCQFAKLNGLIVEPKSISYESELDNSIEFLEEFGLSRPEILKYDNNNVFLYFKKINTSNTMYPREWKVIIKNSKKENIHE